MSCRDAAIATTTIAEAVADALRPLVLAVGVLERNHAGIAWVGDGAIAKPGETSQHAESIENGADDGRSRR